MIHKESSFKSEGNFKQVGTFQGRELKGVIKDGQLWFRLWDVHRSIGVSPMRGLDRCRRSKVKMIEGVTHKTLQHHGCTKYLCISTVGMEVMALAFSSVYTWSLLEEMEAIEARLT